MKIEFLSRCMGKTHKAIEFAHKNKCLLMTFSKSEAQRVFDLAKKMGKPIEMPITPQSELRGNKKSVVIDNADWVLQILLAEKGINSIPMITINDPDIPKIQNSYLNGVWEGK